jgi:hypothetical protein
MQDQDGGAVNDLAVAVVEDGVLDRGGNVGGAGGGGRGEDLVEAVGTEQVAVGGATGLGDAVGVQDEGVTGAQGAALVERGRVR